MSLGLYGASSYAQIPYLYLLVVDAIELTKDDV